jgi:hypothetical protein
MPPPEEYAELFRKIASVIIGMDRSEHAIPAPAEAVFELNNKIHYLVMKS